MRPETVQEREINCSSRRLTFWTEEDDVDMPIHLKDAYNGTLIHSNLENISLYPLSILKMNAVA